MKLINIVRCIVCMLLHSTCIGKTLQIVVSFPVLYDIVRNVTGEHANVSSIIGYGQDAHTYELHPRDIELVRKSDLFIVNGLHFEYKWSNLLAGAVVASDGVTPIYQHGIIDPHAWCDVNNVIKHYVPNILSAVVRADPAHHDYYVKNANHYIQQLKNLNGSLLKNIAQSDARKYDIVTIHYGFGYFAKWLGLRFTALRTTPDGEILISDIKRVKHVLDNNSIKLIFVEDVNNNRFTQLAHDLGAEIGGLLYVDTLPKRFAIDNYIDMLKFDVSSIIDAYRHHHA